MRNIRGVASLVLAAAIWGGVYVVSRVVLRYVPPVPLVEIRLALTILALLPFYRRPEVRPNLGDYALALVSGTLGFGLSLVAQFYGTFWSSAHIGALVTSSSPAFIALLALPVLGERLKPAQVVALALALLGAVVVMAPGAAGGATPRGVLTLILAALTWAVYTVFNRRLGRRQGLWFVSFMTTLFAFLMLLPASQGVLSLPWGHFGVSLYLGIAYIGFISTAVAMYLWNYGFTQMPAANASLFLFVQPVVGTLLGVLMLGERLSPWLWPGALLIVAGVWLALRGGHDAPGAGGGAAGRDLGALPLAAQAKVE